MKINRRFWALVAPGGKELASNFDGHIVGTKSWVIYEQSQMIRSAAKYEKLCRSPAWGHPASYWRRCTVRKVILQFVDE